MRESSTSGWLILAYLPGSERNQIALDSSASDKIASVRTALDAPLHGQGRVHCLPAATVPQPRPNKTDAGNGSKAICRVSNVLRSPSPDPRRSPNSTSPLAMPQTTMIKSAVIAAIISVSWTVQLWSQDSLSPELARLKTGYQAAVTKAVSPLTATYRKELERLLDSFTRAGKLDQALQVKKEIESLDGASLARAEKEAPPKETVPVTAPVTTIEGTTWVAKAGFLERIEFRANGAMTVTNRTKKIYHQLHLQTGTDRRLVSHSAVW